MSKLYLLARTDAIRTPRTARAHKWIDLTIFYGSRGNPRKAIDVRVNIPTIDEDGKTAVVWVNGKRFPIAEGDGKIE